MKILITLLKNDKFTSDIKIIYISAFSRNLWHIFKGFFILLAPCDVDIDELRIKKFEKHLWSESWQRRYNFNSNHEKEPYWNFPNYYK